jgi:hypothetical protein
MGGPSMQSEGRLVPGLPAPSSTAAHLARGDEVWDGRAVLRGYNWPLMQLTIDASPVVGAKNAHARRPHWPPPPRP